ncbi:hypothetical protein A2U01_0106807, partial [Trifolium medium]|nr:hypothetical protein [Trifolium medium]
MRSSSSGRSKRMERRERQKM